MKFKQVVWVAALGLVCGSAMAAPASLPDDWYLADVVRVRGAPLVCPPGADGEGLASFSKCEKGLKPITPAEYLAKRCPGAQLVSLQPYFAGGREIRLVLGYQHPAEAKCPR
jgi:hypothetical protein